LGVEVTFSFSGELFEAPVEAPWVFVALPVDAADRIVDLVPRRPGFGSVRVVAQLGSTEWKTSIFPSKEYSTYVLPVKRAVRDAEQVDTGDTVQLTVRIVAE
jgi:hypothetical protein